MTARLALFSVAFAIVTAIPASAVARTVETPIASPMSNDEDICGLRQAVANTTNLDPKVAADLLKELSAICPKDQRRVIALPSRVRTAR